MNFPAFINPIIAMGTISMIFGLVLSYAGKKLEVQVDERLQRVLDALPGANCAGCGFAGCYSFAEALVEGRAPLNGCPVGGAGTAENIAAILGVKAESFEKHVAFVKCMGSVAVAHYRYGYQGILDCNAAVQLAGGGTKQCTYGCIGLASCVKLCQFGAIRIENNISVVDPSKCTACGKCLPACPKNLIELVPVSSNVRVSCFTKEKGKEVKLHCSVGCIGCKLCEKVCNFDAITVKNNLAKIDYQKCTQCLACVKKCPSKVITITHEE
ncbi:RnfABCDGE type electron transport complex subunit B [Lacrimispora sp.]|uniref:RnfABCDGE type electron transport complex subunit B n=1 Tax=Lacrimispora sp. TaxID=2719234 RepID=UPI0028AAEE89|nr:RnfABCDGE type electron transport complex subunit B [Lacrimispora sp.]